LVKAASVVMNWALPLDDRLTLVKLWSYKVNGKGKATVVTVSSPWLPMSVVPGTMLPPIWFITYAPMQGVGVEVEVGVGVNVAVAVGVGVNVDVGVGLAVAVAVGLGLAVGVGLGVPPPTGAWIATIIGEPVLKKPTVALAFRGGWSASNRKLYSVPQRIALAFWFCANGSVFQVMSPLAWVTVHGWLL
jgi:hypothetical protein